MTVLLTGINPEASLSSRRLVVEAEASKQVVNSSPSKQLAALLDNAEVKQALMASTRQIKQQTDSNIEFSIDDESRRSVVKVIDGDSGEVLRQFPTEEALRVARQLVNSGSGLVQDKA
ncbi:MAG: flagellar protein FlaG [Moraxellaceae bacterium]|nr:flagellar protein FlaG [Moraxellaceae bacterium]MDP1775751.1 flagellar protein FlaG [Moraxellaceae bacterium]